LVERNAHEGSVLIFGSDARFVPLAHFSPREE
jgi:hypothetical protein